MITNYMNHLLIALAGLFTTVQAYCQTVNQSSQLEHNYQKVVYQAADLAKQPFEPASTVVPEELRSLGYQQYRAIRFMSDRALWKGQSNFEVQLFHPGFLYQQPVKINEIITDSVINIPFSTDLFRYDGKQLQLSGKGMSSLDFSGFRIHYPLNSQRYKDELIVFQGASYFRPLGPGQIYGVSARGLAIDTAESSGEEFPFFREFWLVKPMPGDNAMTVYALLDSPSITGAYRFKLLPGIPTRIQIRADLFPRKTIKKLGIAPLTSMFFYGENRVRYHDDFRPEVHDSDGLLVATQQGEWIWRPLSNPIRLGVSSFSLQNPAGFGLLQRDRQFAHYQDMEAKYHQRPSVWVEPKANWGIGRVELVEIPTADETNDNIVAYWVPNKPAVPGQQLSFEYDLSIINEPSPLYLGKAIQTRIGWSAVPGQDNPPPKQQRLFVVDFSEWPETMVPNNLKVGAKIEHNSGEIFDIQTALLPDNKTWRVTFKVQPEGNLPVDMTMHLTANNQRISETWSYIWRANSLSN